MLEHLVGMQPREPRDPYVGLWTQLEDFAADELEQSIIRQRDGTEVEGVAQRLEAFLVDGPTPKERAPRR